MGETDMQPFREHRPTNALTPGALLLMFFGVVLALRYFDINFNLVSLVGMILIGVHTLRTVMSAATIPHTRGGERGACELS